MKAPPAEEVLRTLYEVQGMTMRETAQALGISLGATHKYIKAYGIQTRDRGTAFLGKHHDYETRRKISMAHKGKTVSKETRAKIAAAHAISGPGHKKKRNDGYIYVYFPKHPESNAEGYVMEHRLIMEAQIGRPIRKGEVVHHINHDKSDNRIENLQLMTFKEHSGLHMKERWAARKGGMTYQ